MNTGRYLARNPKRLAFGRYAAQQLAAGRTLRSIALGHGRSLAYVWRSVKAAERVDGATPRRTRVDPLLL